MTKTWENNICYHLMLWFSEILSRINNLTAYAYESIEINETVNVSNQ